MSLNFTCYQHKQSKNIPIASSLHLCFQHTDFALISCAVWFDSKLKYSGVV